MNERRSTPDGAIEVDMFPKEVDGLEHPEAIRFRKLLEEVAEDYNCSLVWFDVRRGTVRFAFDNDVLTAEIIRELEMDHGV